MTGLDAITRITMALDRIDDVLNIYAAVREFAAKRNGFTMPEVRTGDGARADVPPPVVGSPNENTVSFTRQNIERVLELYL